MSLVTSCNQSPQVVLDRVDEGASIYTNGSPACGAPELAAPRIDGRSTVPEYKRAILSVRKVRVNPVLAESASLSIGRCGPDAEYNGPSFRLFHPTDVR